MTFRSLHRAAASAFLCACLAASAACARADSLKWETVEADVRKKFPDVESVTTTELAGWLESGERIVLLDTRSREEYEVSHLPGARFAPDSATAMAALVDAGRDATIVTYCSVGVRSARLARSLQERGVKNVYNLEGSIFRWANEGRGVVRGEKPVREVHPFDEKWGALLDETLRAYRPGTHSESRAGDDE